MSLRERWKIWRERAWWKRYLIYLGLFPFGCVVTWNVADQWAKAEWRRFEREVEASGSSLVFSELIKHPRTDDCFWEHPAVIRLMDDGGTSLCSEGTRVFESIDSDFDEMEFIKKMGWGWEASQKRDLSGGFPVAKLSPEMAISRYANFFADPELAQEMDSLVEVLALPVAGLRKDGFEIDLNLSGLVGFGKLLVQRSLIRLHDGDSALARIDVIATFELARHVGVDGVLIDWLVGTTIESLAMQPLWEGLYDNAWKKNELSTLRKTIELNNLSEGSLRRVLELERAIGAKLILDNLGSISQRWELGVGTSPLIGKFGYFVPPDVITDVEVFSEAAIVVNGVLFAITPPSQLQLNIATYSRMKEATLFDPAVPMMADRAKNYTIATNQVIAKTFKTPSEVFCDRLGGEIFLRHDEMRMQRILAMVAISAEEFRLEQGSYPKTLSDLVPDYFATVPIDLFSGLPLHYKLSHDGRPVIYSVGQNGIDDGGEPRRKREEGDLVWRYSLPVGFTLDDYKR